MDNFRLVFGIVFAVSVFLLFEAWMQQNKSIPPVGTPATHSTQGGAGSVPVPSGSPSPIQSNPTSPPPTAQPAATENRVKVRTDLLLVEISTLGGDIRRVDLTKHRDLADKTKNFILLRDDSEGLYVAQSGVLGAGQANHTTAFTATQSEYVLKQGENELLVALTADMGAAGVTTKTLRFHRNSYIVEIEHRVAALEGTQMPGDAYFQFLRDQRPASGDSKMMPTYTGGEVYTEASKLIKLTFDDVKDNKQALPKAVQDGWIAFVQHYFLGAWLPERGKNREYYARAIDNSHFTFGAIVPMEQQGTARVARSSLYMGPQDQETLKALSPGLEFTVDYGWLRMLAVPIFSVLRWIYNFVGNWGVAIILLTVLIKLAFYPLSAASYKSMAKMKVLAPKLQKLKERFGDDRQKMHQAMMDLYKTEKVNPLGGCLPIVVQIPVFISLYWVLLLSVELRQAPFMLWINDLSSIDPYYVLPVLMGITMFIQTWLNPTPPDPMQARLMKIMPVAFSVFFFFFPAGLVLYWLVNNILSIAQQWNINRVLERGSAPHGKT